MKNICIVIFVLLSALPIHAQELENTYTIKVGIFPLHPLNFVDQDGDATGLYPDIIREIARDKNWSVEFVPGSWSDGLERLQTGEIDLVTTIAYSSGRAEVMDFSREPVVDIWSQVFALPNKIDSLADLEGARVAIMRKDFNGKNFRTAIDKLGISCTIVEYGDHSDVLHAVHDNEVIAGVVPNYYGYRHAKDFGLVVTPILLSPFSVYFAVKKGEHHDLLKHIDSHLTRWKLDKDSYYYERLSYWMGGGEEFQREIIPNWFIVILSLVTGIAILLFFLNRLLNIKVIKRTKELHASEKKYRQLVENAHNIIIRWDKNGTILFINRFGQEFFGYSEDEIIGQNLINTIVPVKDREGKDLHTMINEIAQSPKKYALNENENICKDGRRVFIQWTNQIIPSDNGQASEVLSIGIDATKRKELEEALNQSQKMEAIGTLAGGIAHDFNNLLGIITGNADLALEDIPKDNPAREDVGRILIASDNAKKLVQQILTFSRQDHKRDMLPIQPCITIKESVTFLRSATPSSIQIEQTLCEDVCSIRADITQFQQLLMNLFSNAIHAMDEHGTLEVKGKVVGLGLEDIPAGHYASPGKYFNLSVCDTGKGIAPDKVKRIFDPFFTDKSVDEGTGMGLAIVMGIVQSHKGIITVDTELGKGTRFDVFFPVIDEVEGDKQEQEKMDADVPLGKGFILYVDDEEMLAQTGGRIVERLGYNVTVEINSSRALQLFKSQPDFFDLVITDQTMPDMTGAELSIELLKIRPDLPIIMCTGFSKTFSEGDARAIGIQDYLLKPISQKDLAVSIRKILNENPR